MASITMRKLDEAVKVRLRARAARRGHSMEEEAREILKSALVEETSPVLNLAEAIRQRVEPFGGVELVVPPRQPAPRPPKLT